MRAKGSDERLDPERAQELIRHWVSERSLGSIEFREQRNPANDPRGYDDYEIAYEAVFEPASTDQARFEMYVTTEGDLGFGLETWGRVAQRLGVRRTAHAQRNVAGQESVSIA